MWKESLVCALWVGMVAGFLAPFADQNIQVGHAEKECGTKFYKKPHRSYSTTREAKTMLCTRPTNDGDGGDSDEELFLALFRQKVEQKAAKKNKNPSIPTAPPPSFDFDTGAGVPRASLEPDEIVPLLMTALQNVDVPTVDGGLVAMWDFASDTTKFVFQNNQTEFIESCHETAREFPTSFYGAAMSGKSWKIETELNRVGGDTGWIATQVTSTVSSDGRMRRWQWELRKNRRPPCLGCWKVENIASSDRKGNFEPD